MDSARLHELDLLALLQRAVDHADKDDDTEIGVVPAIDEHRLERRVRIALGRRNAVDDGFQYFVDADAGLGAGKHRIVGGKADDVLDLRLPLLRFGGGQVDLVVAGPYLSTILDRLITVGPSLLPPP